MLGKKIYENPDIVEEDPGDVQEIGIKDRDVWKKGREENKIGVTPGYIDLELIEQRIGVNPLDHVDLMSGDRVLG